VGIAKETQRGNPMVPEDTPNAEKTTPDGADAGGGGSTGVTQPGTEAASGRTVFEDVPGASSEEKATVETPAASGRTVFEDVPGASSEEKATVETPAAPAPAVSPTAPKAGLPTADESKKTVSAGSTKPLIEELKDLGEEGLDKAKEIARGTLKGALEESREYITLLLKDNDMSFAEKEEIKRLYLAAEKHAVMGKVAVAASMGKRIDNFVKSHNFVVKSQKARATQNYLTSLLKLATGAVSTFLGAFGKPLVDKLTDIGLKSVDEFIS
jgi:hypothetical protein